MNTELNQSSSEEILNSLTCGLGFCLSVAALVILIVMASQQGDPWRIVSVSIYGVSLVNLFLFSTLYHSFRSERIKRVFEIFDHCGIYILIAGTYTPFTFVILDGAWRWSLFGTIWGLAALGILYKTFFVDRFKKISALIYLLMGWLIISAIGPLTRNLAPQGIYWLAAGGVIFSLGVPFYVWKGLKFHHTIWHLFVLAGCACHFFAILFYVLPD